MTARRVPAGVAAAVRRQRLRRADLRNRLVPAAAARHRIVGRVARRAARHVHGRHVPRQPVAAARDLAAAASAARLRVPGARDRRCSACSLLFGMPLLGGVYIAWARHRRERHPAARRRREHLPAAADAADGRDAAGDVALGRVDARRRVVARVLLRRQHRRRACSAACSPGSTCCACTTWRSRRSSRSALNVARRRRSRWRSRGSTPHVAGDRHGRRGARLERAAGRVAGVRRDRAVGHDRARRRSDLDAAAVAALRRHGLHVLADPRGVPVRARHRQQHRLGASRATRRSGRGSRSAGASCCSAPRSPGPPTCSRSRCRTGRSIRRSRPTPGSTSSSISSRCIWAMLPGAILWGASFPLALASVASGGKDPARLVGGVYAANTLGAIVGSAHRQPAARRLARQPARAAGARSCVSAMSALLMLESAPSEPQPDEAARPVRSATLLLAARDGRRRAAGAHVQPVPGILVAYGRYAATPRSAAPRSSTSARAGTRRSPSRGCPNGVLNYHNAGKVQASSEPQDMRLQRMLGHLTTLDSAESASACSSSAAAPASPPARSRSIRNVEAADDRRDRAARAARSSRSTSAHYNFDVVDNPKTHVVLDDARHFLLTTQREVRRDHVGPARPVGQGRGDALHARSSSRPPRRTSIPAAW